MTVAPLTILPQELPALLANDRITLHRQIVRHWKFAERQYTPAEIVGLKALTEFQPGREFWVRERYLVTYDGPRNETWIQYAHDRRIVSGAPVHGELEEPNGTYKATLMKKWMSRCTLRVLDVEVKLVKFFAYNTWFRTDPTDWCYVVRLEKCNTET